jgi:hypothetical protein
VVYIVILYLPSNHIYLSINIPDYSISDSQQPRISNLLPTFQSQDKEALSTVIMNPRNPNVQDAMLIVEVVIRGNDAKIYLTHDDWMALQCNHSFILFQSFRYCIYPPELKAWIHAHHLSSADTVKAALARPAWFQKSKL